MFSIIGGLVLLVLGGEALVRGSVATALRLGISPFLIGLTLVGFGTSAPELATSLDAALAGSPGIAVGNVVGSNIANILLILGVAALIAPIPTDPAAMRRDGAVMMLAALACVAVALSGAAGRATGAGLIALLAGYLVWVTAQERRGGAAAELHAREAAALAGSGAGRLWLGLSLTVAGIALTILGARLLVDGAIRLAAAHGVSDAVIGLSIVAVGTSLPELAASVVAAIRRQGDIAIGNILGSNIFNVLAILGTTALVAPLPIPDRIADVDVWIMLAATAAMLAFAWTGRRICRREGAALLAAYAAYSGWLAATI